MATQAQRRYEDNELSKLKQELSYLKSILFEKATPEEKKLKKEVSYLRYILLDKVASQEQYNRELKAKMETIRIRLATFSKLNKLVKILAHKYRKQEGALELLVKLLHGKLNPVVCCKCENFVEVIPSDTKNETKPEIKLRRDQDNKFEETKIVKPPIQPENNKSEEAKTLKPPTQHENAMKSQEVNATTNTLNKGMFTRFLKMTTPLIRPKSNQVDNMISGTGTLSRPRFTYTEKQLETINNKLNHPGQWWSRCGPVDRLNDDAEWRFKLIEGERDRWNEIVERRGGVMMSSRPVQLFNELSGLVIMVELSGRGNFRGIEIPENQFLISLFAPECNENSSLRQPVDLRVQLKIALINGGSRLSENKKFTIRKVCPPFSLDPEYFAQPDNFFCSLEGAERDHLPELIFKFSE